MARGNNYSCYAVREGRRPGIYNTWAACERQVKCYSGARFQGFKVRQDAVKWLAKAGIDANDVDSASPSPPPPPATFDPPARHADASSSSSNASGPFYAVAKGRKPGIYNDWDDCHDQVDGFSGARYKKFSTLTAAQEFCAVYGGGGHFSLFTSEAFQPDQKASFSDEWARLSQSQGWARGTWQYQQQRAAALRNEIQTHFFASQSAQLPAVKEEQGTGAPNIKEEHENAGLEAISEYNQERHEAALELLGFQSMCRAVGKNPGETRAQCEMILKSTLINIVDLLDARRLGRDTTRLPWTNFNAFKAYTLNPQQDKTIPVKSAKADPILRCFLQNFSAPRAGRVSYPYASPVIYSVPAPVAPSQQQSPAQQHNPGPHHSSRWRTPTSAEAQEGWVLMAERAVSEEEDDFEDQGHQDKKVKLEEVIEAQVTKAEEVPQANNLTHADATLVENKPKKRGRPKKVKVEDVIEAKAEPRKRGRPAKKAKVEDVIEAQTIKAEKATEPQVIKAEEGPQTNKVTHADVTQVEDMIVVKEVNVKLERDIEAKNLRRREMKKIQQRWTPSNSIMRSWISSSV